MLGLSKATSAWSSSSTIRSPEIAQKFIALGADPQFGTPAQFAAYVADDYAKWARLAKEAGLKAE